MSEAQILIIEDDQVFAEMVQFQLSTSGISLENIISIKKNFTGHTEYIKQITKSDDVLMMLASEKLRVALATTHIRLKKVAKTINEKLIINKVNNNG